MLRHVNRVTVSMLIGFSYVILYYLQPEQNGGLNNPSPIHGSVLDFPNYCSSPYDLFRRYNVFHVLLSPFFAPNILLLSLHLVGIGILWLLLSSYRDTRHLRDVFLLITATYVLRIIVSLILFYGLHHFHVGLVVSHLFNDCSSGISVLLIPAYVWVVDGTTAKFNTKKFWKLLLVPVVFSINIVEIRMYNPNALANILTFLTSVFPLPLFSFNSEKEPHLPSNNNLVNYGNGKSARLVNYRDKLLSNRWIWIGSFCLLIAAHASEFRNIDGSRKDRKGASLAIAISTVPRPGNPTYLLNTVEAFVEEISTNGGALYSKPVDIYVLSFNNSPDTEFVFNATRFLYSTYSSPNVSIQFMLGKQAIALLNMTIDENMAPKLRLNYNFAASLMSAYTGSKEADFIWLHEDDFPICPNTWAWIRDTLSLATEHNGCGVFLATGGAGLAIKRSVVPQVVSVLLDRSVKDPADVKIQNCLRGSYQQHCDMCHDKSLLVPSHLVFGHIGFVSSLKHNYIKAKRRWSCGWRHAFNGDPDVTTLHTDLNVFL